MSDDEVEYDFDVEDKDDGRKHRAWLFVINNWTASDEFAVSALMKKSVIYGISGKEVGKKGTPHLQSYVRFKDAQSFDWMKKQLTRAHLKVAKGSDKANQKYCSKDHDFREWGTPAEGQGKRNDIHEVADLIKNRQITMYGIMFEYPELYLRYNRGFEKMFHAAQANRSRDKAPEIHWRWGLTGTGKTIYVWDKYSDDDIYVKDGTQWWDGYTQQKVILFDDFDNSIPYKTFLLITDRNPYQGQVKGGYVKINSPIMYITSDKSPEDFWYGNELKQVTRRLTSVTEII